MNKTKGRLNIFLVLINITLMFLLSFGFAMAYFTASSAVEGNLTFYNIGVNWYTTYNSGADTKTSEEEMLRLTCDNLSRGNVVRLKFEDEDEDYIADEIGITVSDDSIGVFVRYYLLVYEIDEDTDDLTHNDSNLEQYFTLGIFDEDTDDFVGLGDVYYTKNRYNLVDTYFIDNAVEAGNSIFCFNAIKLSASAPTDMLEKSYAIFVKFDAIQNVHEAYKAFGDDDRGYLTKWGED